MAATAGNRLVNSGTALARSFFFQAEDGIRDVAVTGVQTCALPILEAFDKTAKLLGLPYPGGPQLAELAAHGTAGALSFPRPMLDRAGLEFSFSGLDRKSGV